MFAITSDHIRAARTLLGWDQWDFAVATDSNVNTIRNLESQGHKVVASRFSTVSKIQSALAAGGVRIPAENDGAALVLEPWAAAPRNFKILCVPTVRKPQQVFRIPGETRGYQALEAFPTSTEAQQEKDLPHREKAFIRIGFGQFKVAPKSDKSEEEINAAECVASGKSKIASASKIAPRRVNLFIKLPFQDEAPLIPDLTYVMRKAPNMLNLPPTRDGELPLKDEWWYFNPEEHVATALSLVGPSGVPDRSPTPRNQRSLRFKSTAKSAPVPDDVPEDNDSSNFDRFRYLRKAIQMAMTPKVHWALFK